MTTEKSYFQPAQLHPTTLPPSDAEVYWNDPAARALPEKAGLIIDASLAFFDTAKIGDKLYSEATVRAELAKQAGLLDDYATEINRLRNVIQAACTGGMGHMIERWKALFPDAPVPSVNAPDALGYATRLAQSIFSKHFASDPHYASGEVVWSACDDLPGVLTQIDNMTAGLVRAIQAPEGAQRVQPEGFVYAKYGQDQRDLVLCFESPEAAVAFAAKLRSDFPAARTRSQPQADQQSQFCPICEARGRADASPAEAPEIGEVTWQQAADAIDNLDDYARMMVGVDPTGPRETLYRFLEQAKAALSDVQPKGTAPALTDMQIDKLLHALDDVALNFGDDLPGLALNSRGLERSREVVRSAFADGAPAPVQAPAPAPRTSCEYCGGTGDVHRADGEWLGECDQCPAAALHAFKNFHRLLCERFGYTHDEKDWRRDQLSLIEFIAAKITSLSREAWEWSKALEAQIAAPTPASVKTDRPFFVYDPENGAEFFKTEQEARAYAAESLKEYRRGASFDGEWSGDVESIKIGRITHVTVERGDDETGYDYRLEPAAPCAAVQAESDHAEFEVWEGDELFAGASGPRALAWAELLRYAGQCEGVVRVFEVSRIERTLSYVPVQPTGDAA